MTLVRWAAFAGILGSAALVSVPRADAPSYTPVSASGDTLTVMSALDSPEPFRPSEEWRSAPDLRRPLPPFPQRAPGFRRGEDPAVAEKLGWPVEAPEALPGALLPHSRIVAYYVAAHGRPG